MLLMDGENNTPTARQKRTQEWGQNLQEQTTGNHNGQAWSLVHCTQLLKGFKSQSTLKSSLINKLNEGDWEILQRFHLWHLDAF